MKDYKRLTPNSYIETIDIAQHDKVFNQAVITQAWNWENKIESGELCDREEVRKETAREILQKLYRRTRNYHGNRCLLTSNDVIDIAKLYGIKLEDEE